MYTLVYDDVRSLTPWASCILSLDPLTHLPNEGGRPQQKLQTGGPWAPQMCIVWLTRLGSFFIIQLVGDFIQQEISSKNPNFQYVFKN